MVRERSLVVMKVETSIQNLQIRLERLKESVSTISELQNAVTPLYYIYTKRVIVMISGVFGNFLLPKDYFYGEFSDESRTNYSLTNRINAPTFTDSDFAYFFVKTINCKMWCTTVFY